MFLMMNEINCVLCDVSINCDAFSLQEHTTSQSFTVLLHYLEYVVGEQISLNNYKICVSCFNLINELEKIEISAKQLKKQLTDLYSACKERCKYKVLTVVPDFPLQDISDNLIQTGSNENNKSLTDTPTDESKLSFECPVCLKKFGHHSRLETHIKKIHPDLDENYEFIQEAEEKSRDNNVITSQKDNETYQVSIEVQQSEVKEKNEKEQSYTTEPEKQEVKSKKPRCRKRNSSETKLYECPECPKKWKSQSELKSHILSHSDVRPFICEICGQAYKHKTALSVHVGMHNGINPFTCVYCNKAFTQKGGLIRHVAIHTGEMHHQCHLCGKRFVHHTSFNIHRLSHSGEKAYKCEVCGLALMSGSHLKRHMRVHTGEKKFACSICGKRFAEKYNLGAHEKLHDSSGVQKRKYRCQKCPNSYDRKVKLEEHIAGEHQNQRSPQHSEDDLYGPAVSDQQITYTSECDKPCIIDKTVKNDPAGGPNVIIVQNADLHNQYLRSLNIYTDSTM